MPSDPGRAGPASSAWTPPYCHRDFRRPEFVGPVDEGIRELAVKRGGRFAGFALPHSPLDVVGWDGTVYPWAFPIHAFQPRVGQVHLPPDGHGTFAARGALVCSFVPRPVDFHAQAVPCPYPHSSVDGDEVLFYASGAVSGRAACRCTRRGCRTGRTRAPTRPASARGRHRSWR